MRERLQCLGIGLDILHTTSLLALQISDGRIEQEIEWAWHEESIAIG